MTRVDELREHFLSVWSQHGHTHAMERDLRRLVEAARQEGRAAAWEEAEGCPHCECACVDCDSCRRDPLAAPTPSEPEANVAKCFRCGDSPLDDQRVCPESGYTLPCDVGAGGTKP